MKCACPQVLQDVVRVCILMHHAAVTRRRRGDERTGMHNGTTVPSLKQMRLPAGNDGELKWLHSFCCEGVSKQQWPMARCHGSIDIREHRDQSQVSMHGRGSSSWFESGRATPVPLRSAVVLTTPLLQLTPFMHWSLFADALKLKAVRSRHPNLRCVVCGDNVTQLVFEKDLPYSALAVPNHPSASDHSACVLQFPYVLLMFKFLAMIRRLEGRCYIAH